MTKARFFHFVLAAFVLRYVDAFLSPQTRQARLTALQQIKGDKEEPNAITKASWYAVEAFGKAFGGKPKQEGKNNVWETPQAYDLSKPPSSIEETRARLKEDNEREYFLSGTVDTLIYDPECEFADPFVSFNGRDRFVENLASLGSFITKYSAKPLDYQEISSTAVATKFMVKLELNLPWKPVLAWPWGVLCEIDPETNLIVLHKESWDIQAWEGVKQIFRKASSTVS
eukprot:CAMPEP_0198144974 /NCGR_PEP_ID=MMETSP1443-20131203/20068_1 /TAXON_ID=186043 /ORGANISM="Entomoneis sp., Strain CCMP2396" /LENGTH=227 /DNA_ID=CAMNT_0043808483 /DNA_START=80 /DNA_END=763 /DNA_ORIENTATION=+